MRKTLTTIWCVCLALAGYFLTSNSESALPQNAISAAPVLDWKVQSLSPTVKYITKDTTIMDTVKVEIHDTVLVDNPKRVLAKAPKHVTDTVYVPMFIADTEIDSVKNRSPGDRKVFTPDVQSPKPAEVILFVDGEKVYSSETVITPVEPIKIDGLQEP